MMPLSSSRKKELERLLRRLRASPRLWDDDRDRVGMAIDRVKLRMMPVWDLEARNRAEKKLERWFAIQ